MKKRWPSVFLFFVFLAACVPEAASTPTPTSQEFLSADVATVEKFYTLINAAQNQGELGKAWDLLSITEQCNPRDGGCDLSYFQAAWWPSQVLYRVYTCGSDRVVAEERLYPRASDPASASSDSRYVRYQFGQTEEGTLVINKRSTDEAPGAECELAVDGFGKP
jgi:hypothetical protein